MKKISAILLALIMMLSMVAMAEDYTITISNAVNGETYNAYKIFDLTYSGDNYAYTIDSDGQWFTAVVAYMNATADENGVYTGGGLTLTPSVNDATIYAVTFTQTSFTKTQAAAFAAKMDENKAGKTVNGTAKASSESVTIEVTDAGYYFVDTTLGSLCSLNTTNPAAEIEEKNIAPTVVKTFADDTTATKSVSINDTVSYKIAVTDGTGTDAIITVHDKMEAGLTLNANSFKVYTVATVEEQEVKTDVAAANYTITTTGLNDGCTFEVAFTADYVKSLDAAAVVYIEYTATVNENVEISTDTNDNTAKLTYSQQTSQESTVSVVSYKFDIVKTNSSKQILTGAQFKLYADEAGENEIKVVKVEGEEGVYRLALATETGVAIEAGVAEIQGLAAGTYYLKETQAPTGYNALADLVPVTITGNNDATVDTTAGTYTNGGLEVVNQTGSELPSTGGIGTTIFYTVGGLMMAAAIVLLVAKKKVAASK